MDKSEEPREQHRPVRGLFFFDNSVQYGQHNFCVKSLKGNPSVLACIFCIRATPEWKREEGEWGVQRGDEAEARNPQAYPKITNSGMGTLTVQTANSRKMGEWAKPGFFRDTLKWCSNSKTWVSLLEWDKNASPRRHGKKGQPRSAMSIGQSIVDGP